MYVLKIEQFSIRYLTLLWSKWHAGTYHEILFQYDLDLTHIKSCDYSSVATNRCNTQQIINQDVGFYFCKSKHSSSSLIHIITTDARVVFCPEQTASQKSRFRITDNLHKIISIGTGKSYC